MSDPNPQLVATIHRVLTTTRPLPLIESDMQAVSIEIAKAIINHAFGLPDPSAAPQPQPQPQRPAASSLANMTQDPTMPEFNTAVDLALFLDTLVDDARQLADMKPAGKDFLLNVSESASDMANGVRQRNSFTPKQASAACNWRRAVNKWMD